MSLEHAPQKGGKAPSPWAQHQVNQLPPDTPRVLRIPETCRISGLTNVQLHVMEKAGTFPARFKLNPDGGKYGACGHDHGEVMSWLERRRASRRNEK